MKNASSQPTHPALTFWTWEWIGGGYNSVSTLKAPTLEAAIAYANTIAPGTDGCKQLIPDLKSFQAVGTSEMAEIDRWWGRMFD